MTRWSGEDLMVVAGSRMLQDRRVVFAGVGAPLLASALAIQVHAPGLTIVLEGGSIGPQMLPGMLPISTNEMRGARGAVMLASIVDTFLYGQRGYYDYGFIGAAQVDAYGNVNTSVIAPHSDRRVRLPGSGGANDIVSSCREILVITRHERRRFVERVDFVTSPGFLTGGDARRRAGLTRGMPRAVVTDLGVMGFEPGTHRMRLEALQPGNTVDAVLDATGFELLVSPDIRVLEPPTQREMDALALLRGTDVETVARA